MSLSREERMTKRTNEANERIAQQTNETNLRINQENNAANLELAQKQNQWNLDQWNRQNAYNDPSAQMARYQAAGLNANSGNIDAGNASPLESAELANQQAGHIDAYQQDWHYDANAQISRILNVIDGLHSVQDMYQEGKLRSQQIQSNNIDLAYKNANKMIEQQRMYSELNKHLQENTDMSPAQIKDMLSTIDVFTGPQTVDYYSGARKRRDLEYESKQIANNRSQKAYQKESKEYDIYNEFAFDNAYWNRENAKWRQLNQEQDWKTKDINLEYQGYKTDAQKEIINTYKRLKRDIRRLHIDSNTKDALQLELMGAMFGTDSKYVSDAVGGIAKAGLSVIPHL